MTPPAYTVPATLPGLLAPQLRALVFDGDEPVSLLVLRVEGHLVHAWERARTVYLERPDALHLDLRDRLTAAHVAWWALERTAHPPGAVSQASPERLADDGASLRAAALGVADPEALAALVMRLAAGAS